LWMNIAPIPRCRLKRSANDPADDAAAERHTRAVPPGVRPRRCFPSSINKKGNMLESQPAR
jgi:hypothetical protein